MASTRAQLVVLLDSKVLSGSSSTTAQNVRDFENENIISCLNKVDDLNVNGGYLGIASGRVDISFITASTPSGKFLRDDGTWQTGGSTYTGTNNRITVSGTIIDISASYVGQTSITTLGTIGTGTWQGSSIATGYTDAKIKGQIFGGTAGQLPFSTVADTVTSSERLFYSETANTSTLTILSDTLITNYIRFVQTNTTVAITSLVGSVSVPVITLTTANMTLGSDATGDVYYRNASGVLTRLAAGAAGTFLRFAGVAAAPIVSTLVLPNAATVNQVVYCTSTNNYGGSANLTFDGTQLMVGSGTAGYTLDVNGVMRLRSASTVWMELSTATTLNWELYGSSSTLRFYNYTGAKEIMFGSGQIGIGIAPSAVLTRAAGSATASTAPDKWTAGTLLTVIEAGAGEYNNAFYKTTNALNRFAEGGCIADFTSDANNTGVAETDLYTYTTKASTLSATGETVEAFYSGTFNDLTATSQLKAYFAGTAIGDTGALTVSATGGWTISILVVRTGASTARASVNITTPGASTALYTNETDLTGLTFTNTNIIKITGTAAGATGGSSDITGKFGKIWWWGSSNN